MMVGGWTIDGWAEGKSSRFTGRSPASCPIRGEYSHHYARMGMIDARQRTGHEEAMTKASLRVGV